MITTRQFFKRLAQLLGCAVAAPFVPNPALGQWVMKASTKKLVWVLEKK